MTYGKSKHLAKRTQSDKAFKVASGPKYDGYQRGLASMVYKFLIKSWVENVLMCEPNYLLASELHRQVSKKFKKRKVYWSFNLLETIFGVLI